MQYVALTERKATAQMNVGELIQIVVNPWETGVFSSKKPKVAVVDAGGVVVPLMKGTAKIEFKPDGGKARTLTIKVFDPYEPTGIAFAEVKTLNIIVGQAVQLAPVLAPATARSTLTWTSGKAKVAFVDENGIVVGLSEGKAKITVKTQNKKKATITVVVSDPYKPTAIAIAEGSALTLNLGESVQLTPVLSPATAQTTLTWKSSKPKVAVVNGNGIVTAVGKGGATITVITANGKKSKIKVQVNHNSIDLSRYLNCDIRVAASQLGLTYGGIEYENAILHMRTDDYSEDGLVAVIGIDRATDQFNICGITIGMKRSDAQSILRNSGWRLLSEDELMFESSVNDICYENGFGWQIAVRTKGLSGGSAVDYIAIVTWEGAWS